MPRYFLELSYKGTNYSGFQVQENARTIQMEVETALQTIYRQSFRLTGSSRTDAGVHALQNFFHFDTGLDITNKDVYNLNAILPGDIAARRFYCVKDGAHCRFDALARDYKYFIFNKKNPFFDDRAWFYPFKIDLNKLTDTALLVRQRTDFIAFSKRNTQVNNFRCEILQSEWTFNKDHIVYHVRANRFLRGMVRSLVSSMLKVARGTMTLDKFQFLLQNGDQSTADFSAPPHGLFLINVSYPEDYMRPAET